MASPPHILIVEDDPLSLKILQSLTVLSKFTSETASSGLEALEKIGRPFDAVLLDLTLPDMDGILLLKHLRTTLGAPVVVVSQFRLEEEKIAAWDAGAEDVVSKPFVPAELLARLRAILRRQPPHAGGDTGSFSPHP